MPTSPALASLLHLSPTLSVLGRSADLRSREPARRDRLSLAIPALDAVLDGGLPRGAITEIFGRSSSGKTTLAHVLMAAATRRGECAAWIDLPNALDPDCAEQAGARLERVLWISPLDRLSALRAADHVLEAGGFRLVILDLAAPSSSSRSVPASVWLRMARAAVRRNAAVVVLATSRLVGAFATMSLEAHPRHRVFVGERGPAPVFEGMTTSLHLRKYKHGSSEAPPVDVFASIRA